jgi:tRNA A-37 threonylcarbamoyl transferase component Bud32
VAAGGRAVREILGDRYEVVSRLGAGAFGEVYEANDTALARRVAIKRIRLDAFAEGPELEEVKQRFVREAQVAARLRHPNVVTIHDIAAEGSSSFIVMEMVEGRTLQGLLRERGRLPLDEALRLLSQVAAALDFAHAGGVVHRDVKPANLMIEPSQQVKVMDFGVAKASSSGNITRTGAIVGTPNYMAPEQARGGAVDGRADLFSLACVLYECLSGQRPFVGDNVTAILLKILNEAPPPLDFAALGLPPALDGVLRRGLAKAPDERYATGHELIEAVRAAAAGPVATPSTQRTAAVPATIAVAGVEPTRVAVAVASSVPAPVPTVVSGPPVPAAAAAGPATHAVGNGSPLRSRRVAVAGAAAALAALVWGVSAVRRGPDGEPADRVARSVTRQEPGFFGRILGSRATLRITAPRGSSVALRLETPLSSETARADQAFSASTREPWLVEGHEAFPAGTRVSGRVAHAAGGRTSGRAELTLEFDRIRHPEGTELPIQAEPLHRIARSTARKDAATIQGAAGVGAVVGEMLGGKKGAAIGGAVGRSAGTGVVQASKGEEIVLPQGASLELKLRAPVTVTVEAPPR